nr:unnamed protein product [Spirometra erinaceieuropaei]
MPKSQCGFRRHRETTDMTFAARQLLDKCQEMRTHLCSTFVDLTKAFNTGSIERLENRAEIRLSRTIHPDGASTPRRHDGAKNGSVLEAFAVTNEVKQGCVLAPTLFSHIFSVMLMDANRDERSGIPTAYRTDGTFSINGGCTSSRAYPQTRFTTFSPPTTAPSTSSRKSACKRSMDLLFAACENFVLVINTKKTVVMHQPPSNTATPIIRRRSA